MMSLFFTTAATRGLGEVAVGALLNHANAARRSYKLDWTFRSTPGMV
jgi:hypothetical protein